MALACVLCSAAEAQQSGGPPLRILVGFGAGGTTDVIARTLAVPLAQSLDRPVLIDNRPGAGGRIAAVALKSALADGSVVMLAPVAVPVFAPLVDRNPSYDPFTDFSPVAQVAAYSIALAVANEHPARTIAELVKWVRADPSRAAFGTVTPGGLLHFTGLELGNAKSIRMTHVAYSGIATLSADVIGGRMPFCIDAVSNLIELHRARRLRIIAVTGMKRPPVLPEVATFREQGLASLDAEGWLGVYVPAKTPKPVIDQLSSAIVKALQTAEIREKFIALGLEPTGTSPEALAAIMAADTARWRPVIKAANFSAD
jgi:tripartite-type tricarboxylate transporter receptor subunit TctC